MLLLGEQDFAATGHDSFDANALVMVTLRQASKYPPAEPEALRVAGPSKGPCRDPKSKSQAPSRNANGRGT